MIRIMAIGDVTSPAAAEALSLGLWDIRKKYNVDFVTVNGENAGFIMGPTPEIAYKLIHGGADVITGGNHTLQNLYLHDMIDKDRRLIRPVNYPAAAPGAGYTVAYAKGYRILVMNVLGRVHMEPPVDNPFFTVEKALSALNGKYDVALLDIHAEATGEKLALAHYFDGKFAVVFGTHTHVPTADLQILPGGTGYVSDLGMCGAKGGIIGLGKEQIIARYVTALPGKAVPAEGALYADAVIFTVDEKQNKTLSSERVELSLHSERGKA
ncbi:MAG: YmdB family metallophosphoesterase [Clostridia bacterium]|nr:YmdB family metallophosphoesterase [Clostridia bacterium]